MKKSENPFFKTDAWTILRSILVLSVIAIIAGALLGLVNYYTQVDEAAVIQKKLSESVFPDAQSFTLLEVAENGTQEGSVIGVYAPEGFENTRIYLTSGKGYGGQIQLFVLIEDGIIQKISVYSASETPGLGATALSKGEYLQRYVGTDVSAIDGFALTKTPASAGEIIPVSGSTVTSNGVLNAMNAVVAYYNSAAGGNA